MCRMVVGMVGGILQCVRQTFFLSSPRPASVHTPLHFLSLPPLFGSDFPGICFHSLTGTHCRMHTLHGSAADCQLLALPQWIQYRSGHGTRTSRKLSMTLRRTDWWPLLVRQSVNLPRMERAPNALRLACRPSAFDFDSPTSRPAFQWILCLPAAQLRTYVHTGIRRPRGPYLLTLNPRPCGPYLLTLNPRPCGPYLWAQFLPKTVTLVTVCALAVPT